ncbi:hypothetical protein UFOVP46_79 [uncultured Caudovirales phage]|uniref:Uncharacterized protein n=1 Tax=uncultured Caudovirales phage TaxID=2100421 RepID=A0A6J5KR19_9CAUD|nr:hypothetical protein UFOVP46_79 [uncultured Caudovirales phage]
MIIFAGAEIPSNRTLLERSNVTNVMLSYWGLKKRGLPKTKAYLISEQFEPHLKVWVDSGAPQADEAGLSRRELEEFAADYEEFIALNHDRIEGWVEFDSKVMGLPWIVQQRQAFENDPKMWVVWHEEYKVPLLQQWASEYQNIAIPGAAIEAVTSLSAITRSLVAKYGTSFHGLAVAKPDNLRQIPFTSTSTMSWLSPMRRGETIVWDSMKLARYPKKLKAQARLRYKAIVERAGLDFKKFVDDDTLEATKVAIWSYLQLEKTMSKNENHPWKSQVADNSDDTLYTGLMEMGGYGSDNKGSAVQKVERPEVEQRDPQEVTSMPIFGYEMKTIVESDGERDVLKDVATIQSNTTSLRQCDTCFVSANCPAFKPASTCGFSLPIEVKTPEQLKQLNTALLEMQAQRVAFMRFAEELNGGYADPNVSQEMDRYFKMLDSIKKLDEQKEFIQITGSRSTAGGVLSQIFGDKATMLREAPPSLSEEKTTMIIKNTLEDK